MKQVLQSLASGDTYLEDVPIPNVALGQVLIQSSRSLISSGTERMLRDFGKASFLGKLSQQPDKARAVLDKAVSDGPLVAYEAVKSKLSIPIPLGYCNVGTVVDAPGGEFSCGERVVSNGPHAEYVRVGKNLCARIPENVDDDTASFTVVGAIALQGIRLAEPRIGETVVVIGLGLIGLMAVQILQANGCTVIGVDTNSSRCRLAKGFGADVVDLSKGEDISAVVNMLTVNIGADAVIICANSKSNEPLRQAANVSRKRGRIVLVGVVGLTIERDLMYEKELSFQVSCSYGPGRYDKTYEETGIDYPVGYVRWTEQRNFQAILKLMSTGHIKTDGLVTHKFDIEKASEAYRLLDDKSCNAIVLKYNSQIVEEPLSAKTKTCQLPAQAKHLLNKPSIAFIGAGNYGSRVLMPEFKKLNVRLASVFSSSGVSAAYCKRKFGFESAASSLTEVLENKEVDTVVICTRHDTHAELVCKSLQANKNVLVEKPLALNESDLKKIKETYEGNKNHLIVGFNRRFSPLVQYVKDFLRPRHGPKSFVYTVNAGAVPKEHWVHDQMLGGGRVLGEACHFLDLISYLSGSKITDVHVSTMKNPLSTELYDDVSTITITLQDGSIGTIHYFSNGHQRVPKEEIKIFSQGSVVKINNFKSVTINSNKFNKTKRVIFQDKGHSSFLNDFVDSIKEERNQIIPFDQIYNVSLFSILAGQMSRRIKE